MATGCAGWNPWHLRVDTVVGGLEHPWDVGFLPDGAGLDGAVLVPERVGHLQLVRGGTATKVSMDLSDVFARGESGMMGLVVHPDCLAAYPLGAISDRIPRHLVYADPGCRGPGAATAPRGPRVAALRPPGWGRARDGLPTPGFDRARRHPDAVSVPPMATPHGRRCSGRGRAVPGGRHGPHEFPCRAVHRPPTLTMTAARTAAAVPEMSRGRVPVVFQARPAQVPATRTAPPVTAW